MRLVSIWLSEHRSILLGVSAFGLWIFASYWYLRGDIARMRRENQPRNWSVDMEAKTGKGGKKSMH